MTVIKATGKPRGPGIHFGNSRFNGATPARKAGDFSHVYAKIDDSTPTKEDWRLSADLQAGYAEAQEYVRQHPMDGRASTCSFSDDH